MVYCPFSIPDSNSCTLGRVLNSLDTNLKANPTGKQYALACLTASVATVVSAVFDVALHAAYLVVKAIPTAFKVTVGKLTGWDQKMSPALDGKEWLTHAYKIYASAALAIDAVTKGWWNPALVVTNGRDMYLMTATAPSKGGVLAASKI